MTPLPVVILAGGAGSRLLPLTRLQPKSMIQVNGVPFIDHQLRLLKRRGVERVVICIGYLGAAILEYVGDGKRYSLSVEYSDDGRTPLGTAGAIRWALPLLSEHFMVLYGDSYLDCDYQAVQHAYFDSGKLGLMTICRTPVYYGVGNVEYDRTRILEYHEWNRSDSPFQMACVDYGLGIFHKCVFEDMEDGAILGLGYTYEQLLEHDQLAAWESPEPFHEIGSQAGLQRLAKHFQEAGT